MDKENNIKVDSFISLGNGYSLDRISHGSVYLNFGKCLVEYNGELYLADTLEEQIYTDEGSSFNFSGMGKHDTVSDIIQEMGLPWLDEGDTNISYKYIDNIKKIENNGQLSEVDDYELMKKLKEFISYSMSTCADNYMSYDEEHYELYGEYKDIAINPSFKKDDLNGIDISESYDSINVSKDTMPYGKINATLEVIDDKPILHLNGKDYDVDELMKNIQSIAMLKRTSSITKEQQELVEIISEQQEKINAQEQELVALQEQRRNLNEK